MKRILILLFTLMLSLGVMTACGSSAEDSTAEDSTTEEATEEVTEEATEEATADDPLAGLTLYTSDTGISLYMEEGYTEEEAEGVACCFQGETLISCREETFETLESVGYDGSLTIEEYAELLVSVNGTNAEVLKDDYGNVYFIYEKNVHDVDLTYYAYVDKGSKSFWTTNFIYPTEAIDTYADKFALWASTITIQ